MENKQDLMVGNLMQDAKGRICIVEQVSVDEEDCKIYAIDGPTTTYPISPIPIRPEILSKNDFKYDIQFSNTYKWHFFKEGLRIAIYIDDSRYYKDFSTWICNPNTGNGWHAVGNKKYVHQLQNLISILTDTQFKINI